MKSRALVVFIFILAMAGFAQAENARVGAFGGVGYSAYQDANKNVNANEKNGWAYGLELEAPLARDFGIETGFQYTQADKIFEIPLLAKFWLSNAIALGVGPYIAPRSGATLQEMEVGAMGTLGLNFAVKDKTGLFIEGRYLRGFNNYVAAANNTAVTRNDVLALAGVRFDLR
jgi:hypothetical protein